MEGWGQWAGQLSVCSRHLPGPFYLNIKGVYSTNILCLCPNRLLPWLTFISEAQCTSGAPSGGHTLELGVQFNDGYKNLGPILAPSKKRF